MASTPPTNDSTTSQTSECMGPIQELLQHMRELITRSARQEEVLAKQAAKMVEQSKQLARLVEENRRLQSQITDLTTGRSGAQRAFPSAKASLVQPFGTLVHVDPPMNTGNNVLNTNDVVDRDVGMEGDKKDTSSFDEGERPPKRRGITRLSFVDNARLVWLKQEIKTLKETVRHLPGVLPPFVRSSLTCYADSPFVEEIESVLMPSHFVCPSFRMYDGTSDPVEHMAYFKQRMLGAVVPREKKEACMCRGFGQSLSGVALMWFVNLRNNSIASFAHLYDTFVQQFSCQRIPKTSDDLYRIFQGKRQPTRSLVTRFK